MCADGGKKCTIHVKASLLLAFAVKQDAQGGVGRDLKRLASC